MLEVVMTAHSVRYTGKNFRPHTYRGCISFPIQSAQEHGQKVWEIKLCSIPKMLEVDMTANSVRYTGKKFHPHN